MLLTARRLKLEVQRRTRQIKDSITEKREERWRGKRVHGQLPRKLEEKMVSMEQCYRWLKSGDIKGETERTLLAAGDQLISTDYI
jgi:IS30 family transposase